MAAAASSSGGSFKYDVFINFRGEDTRRCFVCHLYKDLKEKALDTFIDSEELRKGDDLSELLKAIQESRLSIVVFSKNYASSTWCLKELVQILECKDRQSQIVVPVFYEVDPSHVRKLKGSFAKAFTKYKTDPNLDKEELKTWKSSLKRATNLSGHNSTNNQDDNQLIKRIVEDILKKLIRISPGKTDGLIGMDTHMDKIDSLFKLGADDCRIVGIWGMGGIGKSTIAKAVYEKISPEFEHKCFLDNVKEGFHTKNGAVQMRKEFFSAILNVKDPSTLDGGLNVMRKKLDKKKLLVVLDDVDTLDQIETLIGENPSFGGGSRIIITTRDRKLLAGFSVYEPELFAADEAFDLFRLHAFRTIKFSESYDEISRRAVEYAHGLPLALKVLGALLDNKTVQEWEYELNKIKKISLTEVDSKIGRVLLASYNGLDALQKNIFLDIACFFRGKWKGYVTQFHESCGFFPESGLRVLEERSLVGSTYGGCLEMHDLIQDVGRDIVYREFTKDPGRRSRLWSYEDVLQVLAQNTPAEAVEGIIIDLSKLNELFVNVEALAGMKRLRILDINVSTSHQKQNVSTTEDTCKQHVSEDLKFPSNELRYLFWHGYPLKSLPSDFQPKNLIKIVMRFSHIEQLWEGTKPLPNLEYMNLSFSKYLIRTPDLTEATKLKVLNLEGCTSLLEVHPSISALKTLAQLNLAGCANLVSLPDEICNLARLQFIILNGCSKLEKLPPCMRNPSSSVMVELYLSDCNLLELSDDIAHLSSLQTLELCRNKNLETLPEAMNRLRHLRVLRLEGCKSLKSIPELASSIHEINANNCTSLGTVSTPQLPCDDVICFTFLNCLKLGSTNLFIDIVESDASHATHYQDDDYEPVQTGSYMSLPGSEIPDWFNHQCVGSSVTVQLPPDTFANQLQGFAICAISNLKGANSRTSTLESAFCFVSFKENDDPNNIYFPLFPIDHDMDGRSDMPIESDHMFLRYLNSLDLGEWHNDRKYTEATFRIVTSSDPSLICSWGIPNDSMTWEDCAWITSCGVRLFPNAPSSVDLVCNVENRETEMSSKRRRETLERDEETMGEECSGGPICLCVSLSERMSECTISLRKKQRES